MAGHPSGTQPRHPRHWGYRLLWFVGLWAAGVLVVGAVAFAIRLVIGA